MTEQTTPYIYRGALIEYQTDEMKAAAQAFIKRFGDYTVTLQNDTETPRRSVLRVLEPEDKDNNTAIDNDTFKKKCEVAWNAGEKTFDHNGLTWHARRVSSAGKVCFAMTDFYYSYRHGGYTVYVNGTGETITLYDPSRCEFIELKAPKSGAKKRKCTKPGSSKKQHSNPSNKRLATAAGKACADKKTPSEPDATSPAQTTMKANEIITLGHELRQRINDLMHAVQQGQGAAEMLVTMAKAADVNVTEDKNDEQ